MKTWKKYIGSEKSGKALLSVLTGLSLALGTASSPASVAPPQHADPLETRGATRLMDRTAPERLPSETNSPFLAPLAAAWQQLAPEVQRCPTVRSNHTVNLAVHRIRTSPGRPVLVFIHGLLSDHLTWQYVAAALAADYELWLVDLPGCGESDAPKPSALEPDGYSVTAMGERVLQALQQCLHEAQPGQPLTLIGHSLGGTVVLRMMGAPSLQARYAGVLQRVERIVLLAPCDLAVNGVPAKFQALLGLKGWMVGLGQGLGVLEPKVRALTQTSYHVSECATLEQERRYAHVLEDAGHREAAKAMLLQAVPFDPKTRRPKWNEIDALVADYANIHAPTLIAYGDWDETLSAAMGNKLKDEIAGSLLVRIPGRGHALPTEDPALCADLIRRFQQGCPAVQLTQGHKARIYANSALSWDSAMKIAQGNARGN
jgi:pimeloyl-ACP methyl ester carboxylesterase